MARAMMRQRLLWALSRAWQPAGGISEVASLSTSAATVHAAQRQPGRATGGQTSPGVSTSLNDDISFLHLLTARPSVRGDMVDMHRSSALHTVQRALLQQRSQTQGGDSAGRPEATGSADVPSLEAMQTLPVAFLQRLVHECQLQAPQGVLQQQQQQQQSGSEGAGPGVGAGAHAAGEHTAVLAQLVRDHLVAEVHAAKERERHAKARPSVWVPVQQQDAAGTTVADERSDTELASCSGDGRAGINAAGGTGAARTFSWGSWGVVKLPQAPSPWDMAATAAASSVKDFPATSTTSATSTALSEQGRHACAAQQGHSPWLAPSADSYDPGDPYAPVMDERQSRLNLHRDLKELLRRQRLGHMSPTDPMALLRVPRPQLEMLAEDCGLLTSGKHPELAQRLAALLVQQQREREEEEQAELQGQQEQQGAQEQWRLGQPEAPEQPSHQEVGQLDTQSTPSSDLVTFFDRPLTSTSSGSGSSSSGGSGGGSAVSIVEQGGVRGAPSPLRQEVLRRDAAGQAAALEAVNVHQVAEWLRKAHAQQVMIFKPGHEEEQPLTPRATSQHGSIGEDAVAVDWVIVATATSQRHAYTCAEAVRFQAKDAYAGYLTKLPAEQAGWLRLPRPQVLGGRGMDWLAVEAGPNIMAHILTEPARRFYNLEALYAGAQHAEAVNFQQQSQPDVPSPRRLFPQALAPAH